MKYSVLIVTILACLCAHRAQAGGPALSASAAATWEENITRCPDPAAQHDAMLYDGTAAADWHTQISRDVSMQFEATAGFESCPEYNGLDHVLSGLQASVRRKSGLGPYAPVFRAEMSLTGSLYRDSQRDGTRFDAALSWTKRWTESWQTVLNGELMHNNGRAQVYDYRNRGLSFEVHYDLSARWQLTGGMRRQWGDQITYAWLGGSGADFPYAYEIWKNTTPDSTFGRNWYAYTMDARADSVWLAVSPAWGKNRALPLRFEQTSIVADGESYRVKMISVSFIQRF